MSTRARIGIQQGKRIIASYQHWDGYTGGLGYNLIENWEDPEKVTRGIMLGDSSKWHYIVGDEIDFEDRTNPLYDVQNVYYGRDRGEKNCGYKIYKDAEDFKANGFHSGEQFIYLAKLEGKKDWGGKDKVTWYYVESTYTDKGKEVFGDWKLLEKDAINDHINILKRCMEQSG